MKFELNSLIIASAITYESICHFQALLRCSTNSPTHLLHGINTTMRATTSPTNHSRTWTIYWKSQPRLMLLAIRQQRHTTTSCYTFTHRVRLACQRRPSSRTPVSFSWQPESTTWATSNRTTSSTRHCPCITQLAASWVLAKRCFSAQPLSSARNSLHLATSPIVKSTNARYDQFSFDCSYLSALFQLFWTRFLNCFLSRR